MRTTLPRAYRRAFAEGRLTADDQRLIKEFLVERQATRQIRNHRVLKTRYDLIPWRRLIPRPFAEMTIGDVYAGLNALQTGKNARGTPSKQNTKHDYVQALRLFCLWLIETEYSAIPVDEEEMRR